VTANIAPQEVSDMCRFWKEKKYEKARALHYKLEPLNHAMFIETNPIPVKTAVAMMGKIREEFRLPLCEMSEANREKLKKTIKDFGLIK